MNIVIVNHYAGSMKRGMEFRHFYLARHWIKSGHKVKIISASFSHLRNKNIMEPGDPFVEIEDGVEFNYLKARKYSGNGLGRVLNMLDFYRELRHARVLLEGADIIIVSTPHLFAIPVVLKHAKSLKIPFILEVRDIWPMSLVELLGVSRFHPLVIIMRLLERFAYRNSNIIVSLLPNAKEHFARFNVGMEKIAYVPNGIDAEHWSVVTRDSHNKSIEKIEELKRDFDFLVMYLGTIGSANSLEPFLQAASMLGDPKIAFVLVGTGNKRDQLKAEGNPNTYFIDPIPKDLVPTALGLADALYIGWKRCPRLYRFGISPNKIMDYMMAAKPIIHAVEAFNDPVKEARAGISVPPEDSIAIAAAVRELVEMGTAKRNEMGEKGKKYVLENLDYSVLAAKYVEIFKTALAAKD